MVGVGLGVGVVVVGVVMAVAMVLEVAVGVVWGSIRRHSAVRSPSRRRTVGYTTMCMAIVWAWLRVLRATLLLLLALLRPLP